MNDYSISIFKLLEQLLLILFLLNQRLKEITKEEILLKLYRLFHSFFSFWSFQGACSNQDEDYESSIRFLEMEEELEKIRDQLRLLLSDCAVPDLSRKLSSCQQTGR